jgi:protein-tyrosine phosphatase
MAPVDRTGVLFVCMGNICRSPLAEGVFLHKLNARGVAEQFRVESAGCSGWHAGERPDPRALEIARKYGVVLPGRARQVTTADLGAFDQLICMDRQNLEHLIGMGALKARTRLLLEVDPRSMLREVPDPYYGGLDGFELVYRLIDAACETLADQLLTDRQRAAAHA